eukprot:3164031-Amphidinium_carterae.2
MPVRRLPSLIIDDQHDNAHYLMSHPSQFPSTERRTLLDPTSYPSIEGRRILESCVSLADLPWPIIQNKVRPGRREGRRCVLQHLCAPGTCEAEHHWCLGRSVISRPHRCSALNCCWPSKWVKTSVP